MINKKNSSMIQMGIRNDSSGILKGESTVPLILKLKTEVKQFVREHVPTSQAALIRILEIKIDDNEPLIVGHKENPIIALKDILDFILSTDNRYFEFVRQLDQLYGKMFQEKPHFQLEGQPAHKDDQYTHESVRPILNELLSNIEM